MARTRARTKTVKYVADDPSTPENEAWVDEKPEKKSSKKAVSKKSEKPKEEKE